MEDYKELDFYNLDELLTEEERIIRDTVRDFVTEKIMPHIAEYARKAEFPKHLIPEFGAMGLLGSTIQGYGCAGLNYTSYGLIMQELERCDSGIRSFASVQGSLVMYPIFTFGSGEQKNRWLPKLATGEAVGCFGLTEPDFGSNPSGMRTHAQDKGDHWLLNGAKMWITNGTIADVAVVWAKTEDGTIRGFLVEKGMKGFTAPETKNKFSLRASVTSELIFQDVKLPKENILPKSDGLKSPLMCLSQARYGICWGALGAAQACFHEALSYSKTRIQFEGKPIASHQLIQAKLAEMGTEITKAQMLCHRLGRLKDANKATPQQISLAKRNNVHEALKIARACRDILGANGITDEYQVGRHMCNLESVYTYEGTHNIHTLILGHAFTGIPAYS